MATRQSPVRLTRREMLGLAGALAGGVLSAGCRPKTTGQGSGSAATIATKSIALVTATPTGTPTPTPPAAPTPPSDAEVTVMISRHELPEEQEAQFEADHPGISIELLDPDEARLFAMYAAGDPPDLIRVRAPSIPGYLARDMLRDLTQYFEASTVLDPGDLAIANDYFRANGPLEVGTGPIYGMCRDFSPDLTIFINTQLFEDAGLDVPSDGEPLTYQEIYGLAGQLVQNGTAAFGYGYETRWIDRIMTAMLSEMGKSVFAGDCSRLVLAEDEDALAVARYYFDLAANGLAARPINPGQSWIGGDFGQGMLAMLQYGFGFGAMAESEITAGSVMMLPAPTWSGERRSPTLIATGVAMADAGDVPDAAWAVFEWYNGGQPAVDRATSGWGVPALTSLWHLMPDESEYEQQKLRVVLGELALETPILQYCPLRDESLVADSWHRHLERALQGDVAFEEMIADVEAEVNRAIREGIG